MTKVLGRVVPSMDRARGPDAKLSVCVPEEWILEGATIEIVLPRNLACAACEGGGCDACERSGAVSLRGRREPAELVEVVLPSKDWQRAPVSGVLLRLADRGGLPAEASELPRGNLLIALRVGSEPDAFVTRVARQAEPPALPAAGRGLDMRRVGALVAIGLVVALLLWRFLSR